MARKPNQNSERKVSVLETYNCFCPVCDSEFTVEATFLTTLSIPCSDVCADELIEALETVNTLPDKSMVLVIVNQGNVALLDSGEVTTCILDFDKINSMDDLPANVDEFAETFTELEEILTILSEAELLNEKAPDA